MVHGDLKSLGKDMASKGPGGGGGGPGGDQDEDEAGMAWPWLPRDLLALQRRFQAAAAVERNQGKKLKLLELLRKGKDRLLALLADTVPFWPRRVLAWLGVGATSAAGGAAPVMELSPEGWLALWEPVRRLVPQVSEGGRGGWTGGWKGAEGQHGARLVGEVDQEHLAWASCG
jgi:hypothetical protein